MFAADKICQSAQQCGLPNVTLTSDVLQTVVKNVFIGVGILSVIFLIIGGFRYTFSGGDPNNVKKAKETIIYAVIGLVISLLVFTLVAIASRVAGGGNI